MILLSSCMEISLFLLEGKICYTSKLSLVFIYEEFLWFSTKVFENSSVHSLDYLTSMPGYAAIMAYSFSLGWYRSWPPIWLETSFTLSTTLGSAALCSLSREAFSACKFYEGRAGCSSAIVSSRSLLISNVCKTGADSIYFKIFFFCTRS